MRLHLVVLLMAATNIIGCSGIRTEPSAITPPPGAMRICDEGVISAPGVVSARPNFVTWAFKDPDDFRPRYVQFYDSEPIAISTDGVDWRAEYSGNESAGDATPVDPSRGGTQFAQSRRNLYFTTINGIVKMTSHDVTALELAGLGALGTGSLAIGGAGSWLLDSEGVAYRWTLTRVDVNGLVVTSAPAPYQSIENGTGVADGVIATIPLPAYAQAGDVLRIFRSLVISSAATPADTMLLAGQVTLDAGDIAAAEVVFEDETAQAALGEALYTNSTRGGITGANEPPPRSFALTAWQDSLWAGSTLGAQTLVLDVFDSAGFPIAEEQALGVLQPLTYGTTNGSPLLTLNSGDDTGLANGHSVVGSGIPVGARVLSFVPGVSITLDVNATATAFPVAMVIQAVHTIDGEEFLAVLGGAETAASINEGSTTLRARYIEPAGALAGRPGYFRILIERVSNGGSAFTFATTATGGAFSYTTPDGGARVSAAETHYNRVAWSKPQQPESFRGLDYVDLGRDDPDSQVMAFAPLSDALLVFKLDGVWSIFGSYPNFSSERIDDAIIMGGDAVTVIDDVAYARTNRGILALTGAGVAANLSEGVISGDLVPYDDISLQWARAWPTQGLVLFGVDLGVVYVWNVATRAWCRWTIPALRFTHNPATGTGYVPWDVDRWEVRESVPARGYDETHTIASADWSISGDGLTITIASLGTYAPAAGDVVTTSATTTTGVPSAAPQNLIANVSPGDLFVRVDLAAFPPSGPFWVRLANGPTTEDLYATGVALDFPVRVVLGAPAVNGYSAGGGTATPLVSITTDEVRRVIGAVSSELTLDSPLSHPPGAGLIAYEVATGVLEWQRQGVTAPSTAGFIRELQVHLDQTRSNTTPVDMTEMRLTVGATSDQGTTRYDLVATPTIQKTYSRPVRVGVSRQVGRSTHLYPFISISELFAWKVLGIALVGNGVSDRVRRA